MSPQRSTLSRIGSDYTAPVDIRAQRQYRSGMYRPEDNAYIQNYVGQDNLKHLFYTDCSNAITGVSPSTGMFVRPDNSTLFVTNSYEDPLNEVYDTSNAIVAYSLINGSIKSLSSSVTTKNLRMAEPSSASYNVFYPSPSGISFKPDGSKLIFCGNLIQQFNSVNSAYYYYGPVIFQYDLNTEWTLNSMNSNSTFTWDGVSYNNLSNSYSLAPDRQYALDGESIKLTADNSSPQTLPNPKIRDIFVKPDGTRLYYLRNDVLYQSNISSSWDIGSNGGNLSAAGSMNFADTTTIYAPNNYIVSISFSSDGSNLYLLGRKYGGVIYVYNLSTPWNITTAAYNSFVYVGQYKTLGYNSSGETASSYYGTSMAFLNNEESLIVSNYYTSNRFFQFDTLAF